MTNVGIAFAIVLMALTFTGCGSQSIPEPKREPLRAQSPEVAAPATPCRRTGRTTMVRGDCPVDWDGQTVRVSGTCDVTPGRSSAGSCLRLQISPPGGTCIITDYQVRLVCNRTDTTLLKRSGKVLINGPTECQIFQQADSTAVGLASTRYSPVVCEAG